jgi:hypothetical protein
MSFRDEVDEATKKILDEYNRWLWGASITSVIDEPKFLNIESLQRAMDSLTVSQRKMDMGIGIGILDNGFSRSVDFGLDFLDNVPMSSNRDTVSVPRREFDELRSDLSDWRERATNLETQVVQLKKLLNEERNKEPSNPEQTERLEKLRARLDAERAYRGSVEGTNEKLFGAMTKIEIDLGKVRDAIGQVAYDAIVTGEAPTVRIPSNPVGQNWLYGDRRK